MNNVFDFMPGRGTYYVEDADMCRPFGLVVGPKFSNQGSFFGILMLC